MPRAPNSDASSPPAPCAALTRAMACDVSVVGQAVSRSSARPWTVPVPKAGRLARHRRLPVERGRPIFGWNPMGHGGAGPSFGSHVGAWPRGRMRAAAPRTAATAAAARARGAVFNGVGAEMRPVGNRSGKRVVIAGYRPHLKTHRHPAGRRHVQRWRQEVARGPCRGVVRGRARRIAIGESAWKGTDVPHVVSLSVSMPRLVKIGAVERMTSIIKEPCDGPIHFGPQGPAGNRSAVHPEAVYAIGIEAYGYWAGRLGADASA